jgi:hypothetical protein
MPLAAAQLMELSLSELDAWTFKKDANGSWIGLRHSPEGEALTASRADYDTFEECIADARRHGYKG